MQLTRIRQFASALGLVAAVLGAGALAQQQPSDEPRSADVDAAVRHLEVLAVEDEAPPEEGKTRKVEKFNIRLAGPADGYWIGMQLDPASDALRSQLKIEGERGLVVTELFPDTPAVKSGFAKHDVIVKVDDQPATDVEAFNKIVQETKGEKELTVTVYRGGEPHTIKVTPAKRPGDQQFNIRVGAAPGQGDAEDALIPWMPQGIDLEHPMRVEFYNPGLVVGRSAEWKLGDLPKNLSISISKSGEQAAKIVVSKDGEKWEVTEKELEKLPPEIRGHVERSLRPGPWEARMTHVRPHIEFVRPGVAMPRPTPPSVPGVAAPSPVVPPQALPAPAAGNVDRRLEEVNDRLERLQKAVDALIEQRAKEADVKPQQ